MAIAELETARPDTVAQPDNPDPYPQPTLPGCPGMGTPDFANLRIFFAGEFI